MRAIYVPVFDRFFESSIMREELAVRFVMLALIRLAWRSGANGEVDIDPVILAGSINIPAVEVEAALHRLMEPDPSSHSPDEDGRRIVPLDPNRPMRGWRLVNWEKYRVLVNRLNDAARKRDEYHENKDTSKISESLPKPPPTSENLVTRRDDTKTIRDEDNTLSGVPPSEREPDSSKRVRYPADFEAFWMAFAPPSRRLGKGAAAKIWDRLAPEDRKKAVETLPAFKESNRGKEDRHIATAPTYLSQRRFDDFDGTYPPTDRGRENYRKQMEKLKEGK